MIKLIRISKTDYIVSCPSYYVYAMGSLEQAIEVLDYCGVSAEEINFALEDMKQKGNDRADFGVNKDFIFSDNTSNWRISA